MRFILSCLVIFFFRILIDFLFPWRAQSAPDKVGYYIREDADTSRSNWNGDGPRPLRSEIWYPAGSGGNMEVIRDTLQFAQQTPVFRNAGIAGRGKYPLVLISHGAQGNSRQMRWMAFYLASKGYIAVIMNHNGSSTEERTSGRLTLSDFCMWERPRDISVLLDHLLSGPGLASRIDRKRIFAAGFSLGGTSVLWLGGARLNLHSLETRSGEIPPEFMREIREHRQLALSDSIVRASFSRAENDYSDKRIRAIFSLAPAIGQGFEREGLAAVHVPVQLVTGDQDLVNPMAENALYFSSAIPSAKKLIILPGERGHYTRPPKGRERPGELLEVSRLAFEFFQGIR